MKQKSSWFETLTVGVLCGGESSERKISLKSGKAIWRGLREAGFRSVLIDPSIARTFKKKLAEIDIAFIALHGRGGEDGTIQKVLLKSKIPFTGSDPEACRLSLDKHLTKKVLVSHGLPTPSYEIWDAKNWKRRLKLVKEPVFIKPLTEGSSIGTFAVDSPLAPKRLLRSAVHKYGRLIAERKIVGREFTVGVVNDRPLPVIELKPSRKFYDFKAKYTKGMTEYVVPAKVDRSSAREMQKLAVKTHKVLKLRDMSRIDFMMDGSMKPYILEANAIPGFTELSLLPKAARCAGISFPELCKLLVYLAYKRSKS